MYCRYGSSLSQECNISVTKGRKGKGFGKEWSAQKDRQRESGREPERARERPMKRGEVENIDDISEF